jgi:site-specific recombinase XerD
MIADMSARNLGPASQTSNLRACKRFATWLGQSPETATPDDVKHFQLHLIESGTSICTRNQTMTGVKFLLRVTLRRHDLAAEVFHLRKPIKVPLVLSRNEVRRILAMAPGLKARVMLSLAYRCGLRAREALRSAPCPDHIWRLRTSSAPMELRIGQQTRGTSASTSLR